MTDLNHAQPGWSTSKVNWEIDYYASRPSPWRWAAVVGIVVAANNILLLALEQDPDLQPRGAEPTCLVIAFLLYAIAVVGVAWIVRSNKRWQRLRANLWDSNGCACPWCAVRTDTQPCLGHGFTASEHELLLRYWESVLSRTKHAKARALLELSRVAPHRPLFQRITGPVDRLRLRSLVGRSDPELTALERLRAGIPYAFVLMTGALLVGVGLLAILPYDYRRFVLWCGVFWLMWAVLDILLPLARKIHPRCAKCGHLCATGRPALCPECGANLRAPSAVVRVERQAQLIALRCGVVVAFVALWYFSNALIAMLPNRVQHSFYSVFGPSRSQWLKLDPDTMTQAEVDDAANLLIEHARRSRSEVQHGQFLNFADYAGKLTPAMAEQAARVSVQATLSVEQDGDAVVATVSPLLRTALHETPRLVFGGVSIDGGPWTAPAEWSLFLREVTESGRDVLRKVGDLEPLPEAQLVFTARIDGVQMGTHAVRARCWIVVSGNSWERYTPTFDENGVLIPPDGSKGIYPLDLEATVSVR